MTFQELSNIHVTSIHYPALSDYFDWRYTVEDLGEELKIGSYRIAKYQIQALSRKDKRIELNMKNGDNIFLFAQ